MSRRLGFVLLALAVAAAAVAVNLVLLGNVGDRNDRVGNLSPVAPGLVAPAAPGSTLPTSSGDGDDD